LGQLTGRIEIAGRRDGFDAGRKHSFGEGSHVVGLVEYGLGGLIYFWEQVPGVVNAPQQLGTLEPTEER
jgi:hypothetical protein